MSYVSIIAASASPSAAISAAADCVRRTLDHAAGHRWRLWGSRTALTGSLFLPGAVNRLFEGIEKTRIMCLLDVALVPETGLPRSCRPGCRTSQLALVGRIKAVLLWSTLNGAADSPHGCECRMTWKLHCRNDNFREPGESCSTYSSQAEALNSAYELFIHPGLHKTPFSLKVRTDSRWFETRLRHGVGAIDLGTDRPPHDTGFKVPILLGNSME